MGLTKEQEVNLIKPYARIMSIHSREDGIRLLRQVEVAGRVSHRSEDAMTTETWEKFIRNVVMGHGDWSIVEHVGVAVDFYVDRGITHEIVRHRLASYTQESTRFVNYEKKMPPSFVEPPGLTDEVQRAGNGEPVEPSTREMWRHAIHVSEDVYKRLLARGLTPQIARSVFPNALASRIIMTCNLRNWRHFLLMRTTREAHPQMREVTIPLLAEFKEKVPLLFDDIEPMAKQVDNLGKPR